MFGIGRNKKAFAGLYAVAVQVIVFPQKGIAAASELGVSVQLSDPETLGAALLSALKKSKPLRDKKLSLGAQGKAFADRMEEFRKDARLGLARFHRDLEHISAFQTPEQITLTLMRPVHGRFAFEGSRTERCLEGAEAIHPATLGRAVAELLR